MFCGSVLGVFGHHRFVKAPPVALLGFGAIGQAILQSYPSEMPNPWLGALIVRSEQVSATRNRLAAQEHIPVVDALPEGIELMLECAGHSAVSSHVVTALSRGVEVAIVSTGALADPVLAGRLEQAAIAGNTRLHLLPGAVGGLDALAAARAAGLSRVVYRGRKPPMAWAGTPAETLIDLSQIRVPTRFFSGTAREAARQYPKNANVAATIALAGLGLDDTQVELFADPTVTGNHHSFEAEGVFGQMQVALLVRPLADNRKTSALTVGSAVRFLRSRQPGLII